MSRKDRRGRKKRTRRSEERQEAGSQSHQAWRYFVRASALAMVVAVYLGAIVAIADLVDRKPIEVSDGAGEIFLAASKNSSFEGISMGRPTLAFWGSGSGRLIGIVTVAFAHKLPLKAADSMQLYLPAGASEVRAIAPVEVGDKRIAGPEDLGGTADGSGVRYSPEVSSSLTESIPTRSEKGRQIVTLDSKLPFALFMCDAESDPCAGEETVMLAVMFQFPATYSLNDGLVAKVVHVEWNPAIGFNAAQPPWGRAKILEDLGLSRPDQPPHVIIEGCSCTFAIRDVEGGGYSEDPDSRSSQEGDKWQVEWRRPKAIEFPVNGRVPRWIVTVSSNLCLPLALGIPIVELARRAWRRRGDTGGRKLRADRAGR